MGARCCVGVEGASRDMLLEWRWLAAEAGRAGLAGRVVEYHSTLHQPGPKLHCPTSQSLSHTSHSHIPLSAACSWKEPTDSRRSG